MQLPRLFGPSKAKLLLQMGSADNKIALEAVKKLRDNNHFKDGTFRGIHLAGAKLCKALLAQADMEGAQLPEIDLREAYLGKTNLRRANLQHADLRGSNMRDVILVESDLSGADLRGAHLASARLQKAIMIGANLCEANLWGANLQDACLDGAEFDYDTVMPDGHRWLPDCDVVRFTDPTHPQFWRSDRRYSPSRS